MMSLISTSDQPTGSQSIDRAAQLLVAVAESDEPLSVGDLVERTDLPKSTVSRLVAALERNALVQREAARGPLRPGPVLLRLARRGVTDLDLEALGAGALDRLADRTGETVNLAVSTPRGVDHLSQVDSRHFIGSTNWLGRLVPHHCTAVGKVFLAFGAAPFPRSPLERLTPHTVTDPAVLRVQLDDVRRQDYALVVGELEPGLTAIAAPVRGAAGGVVAALTVSGPDHRLPAHSAPALAKMLMDECAGVSARLGYRTTKRGAA